MNKTVLVTLVIVVLAVIGGIVYSSKNNTATEPTAVIPTGQNSTNEPEPSTPPTPPVRQAGIPTVVTGTGANPTDVSVVVSGDVNPNGGLTNYWFEYGLTSNLGSRVSNQMLGSGYVTFNTPAYIKGLTKNTTYYFRLVAENQYGKVAGNQYTFKTTSGVSEPVGSAPLVKTLSATGVSRNTLNLNGEVTPNKGATQYWFEYGTTANLGNTSASASVGDGSAKVSESVSISNLNPDTTYYFRINAQNQFGTVNGAILNAKTSGPVAATAPKVVTQNATSIASTTATLKGSVNPNGAETRYWFVYGTDSPLDVVVAKKTNETTIYANMNTTSVEATILNLKANMTYYFQLVAVNSQGTVTGDKLTFKTKK